jgi:hypothetical protein
MIHFTESPRHDQDCSLDLLRSSVSCVGRRVGYNETRLVRLPTFLSPMSCRGAMFFRGNMNISSHLIYSYCEVCFFVYLTPLYQLQIVFNCGLLWIINLEEHSSGIGIFGGIVLSILRWLRKITNNNCKIKLFAVWLTGRFISWFIDQPTFYY